MIRPHFRSFIGPTSERVSVMHELRFSSTSRSQSASRIPAIGCGVFKSKDTVLQRPEVRQRLAATATDIYWSGPQDFDAFLKTEQVKWTDYITEAGIQPE